MPWYSRSRWHSDILRVQQPFVVVPTSGYSIQTFAVSLDRTVVPTLGREEEEENPVGVGVCQGRNRPKGSSAVFVVVVLDSVVLYDQFVSLCETRVQKEKRDE